MPDCRTAPAANCAKPLTALALVAFFAATLHAQEAQHETTVADQRYAAAAGLQRSGLYDQAVPAWLRFLEQFPDDPRRDRASHYLGACYLQLEQYDAAVERFREVVDEHPDSELLADSYLNLGVAHFNRAHAQGTAADYEAAAQAFGEVLQRFPDGPQAPRALYGLGETYYRLEQLDQAVVHYRRLVDEHPDDELAPDALYALGVAEEQRGQADAARAAYARFLVDYAEDDLATDVQLRLGEIHFAAGEFTTARTLFEQLAATEGYEQADFAMLRAARCLFELDQPREAARAYWDVPRRFPETAYYDTAVLDGGKCYFSIGEYDTASQGLELLLDRNTPEATEAAHWVAQCRLQLDQPEQALEVVERALQREPPQPMLAQLLLDRADALYELPDRRAEARDQYADVAGRFPQSDVAPQARYMAAFVALEAGDHAAAQEHGEAFLTAYPSHELEPDVRYVVAESLLQLGRHAEAAAALAELTQRCSGHADVTRWTLRLGLAQHLAGNHDAAVAALQPLLSDLPQGEQAAEALYLVGRSRAAQGNHQEAAAALRQAYEAAPQGPQADETLLALAGSYQELAQPDLAAAALTRLLDEHPNSELADRALLRLGDIAYARGDYTQAGDYYRRVVTDFPDSALVASAQHGIAWSLFSQGQHVPAEQALSEFIATHPESDLVARAHYVRGMARQQLGRHGEAADDLQRFLATNPEGADALDARYVLGLCQVGLDQQEQALATFRAILVADPEYAGADKVLYETAWALVELGRGDEAAQTFARLADEHPESPFAAEASFRVGESHYAAERFEEAGRAYRAAFERAGDDRVLAESAVYKLGWCYLQRERYDEAAQTFRAQLSRFPEGELAAEGRFALGETEFRRDQPEAALPHFQQVAAADSDQLALARLRIGQCHERLQHWAEARDAYAQLLERINNTLSPGAAAQAEGVLPDAHYGYGFALQNLAGLEQNGDRSRELYREAIEAYREVTDATSDVRAARAQFMIGECLFALGEHREAAAAFLVVEFAYGETEWTGLAHFEAGRCFEVLEDREQAIEAYRTVVEQYPDSPRAEEARRRLEALTASSGA